MGPTELRPRGVGQILDVAIELYGKNVTTLIGAAAVVVVPVQLVLAAVLLAVLHQGSEVSTSFVVGSHYSQTVLDGRLLSSGLSEVADLLTYALVTAVCVTAVSEAYLGRHAGIGRSLNAGWRRLGPLILMEIVYAVGQTLGFLLLIIPGIWLYAAWSVRVPALVLERTGPLASLGRSRRLVKGRWWPTAGVLLLASLSLAVVGGFASVGFIAAAVTDHHPSLLFAVSVRAAIKIITGVLLQPLAAAIYTVLYYDLRIRNDGDGMRELAAENGLGSDSIPDRQTASGYAAPAPQGTSAAPPYWPPPPGWQPGG